MPRGYAYVEISALATLPFAFHTKDNAFHRFPYDVVSCGTPSSDIDVLRRGWVHDNNASGETDIDSPAEAGPDWWARGLRCKRSHREAHRGIGDLIDPDVYGNREDSIVPLVLIPISGCTSYATGSAWQRRLSMTVHWHGNLVHTFVITRLALHGNVI